MKDKKIGIIGAGLTGLIAAKELSKKGFDVTIIEKLEVPGGRIRSEKIDGWILDVGFQVILTAYPYLKKHVNYEKLDLVNLDAGTNVYGNNLKTVVGDPTRVKSVFWKTLFSPVGSIKDKFLIFKLKLKVDKLSNDEIFKLKDRSSYEYLKAFGFSEKIINNFFKPFFSGIFLENKLETSSKMLLFVFKMFSQGNAAIPKNGMKQLGQVVADSIEGVTIKYNTTVKKVEGSKIILENHEVLNFDFIVNTIPSNDVAWHNSDCFYFEHKSPRLIKNQRIGLIANNNQLINNIFYPSSINKPDNKDGKELLSVTVVDNQNLRCEELKNRVIKEMKEVLGLNTLKFIKHYSIPKSLPNLKSPSYQIKFHQSGNCLNVGDYLSNGSQNAACKTGEDVAEFIFMHFSK